MGKSYYTKNWAVTQPWHGVNEYRWTMTTNDKFLLKTKRNQKAPPNSIHLQIANTQVH